MVIFYPRSYTIVVRNGSKYILKEVHKDYEVAMERLEKLETVYGSKYTVDFQSNY